jgi:hypothetical protein
MWLRMRSIWAAGEFGFPESSRKNQAGVWLCQTSV